MCRAVTENVFTNFKIKRINKNSFGNCEKALKIINQKVFGKTKSSQNMIQKPNGEIWDYEIEKDYGEELGLEFGGGIMDKAKRCSNKCMFCFIDQNPKGMRETLYFKDDDSRPKSKLNIP